MHSTSLLGLLKEISYLRLWLMPSTEGLIFLKENFGFNLMSKIRLQSYSVLLAKDQNYFFTIALINILIMKISVIEIIMT